MSFFTVQKFNTALGMSPAFLDRLRALSDRDGLVKCSIVCLVGAKEVPAL